MAHGRLHALLEIARTRTQSAASASAINDAQDASMRMRVGLDTSFDGASINFLESVSMVPLSTFGKTFAKFAQISLKKKGRGVSEGPRREKISEKSQNTTPF